MDGGEFTLDSVVVFTRPVKLSMNDDDDRSRWDNNNNNNFLLSKHIILIR